MRDMSEVAGAVGSTIEEEGEDDDGWAVELLLVVAPLSAPTPLQQEGSVAGGILLPLAGPEESWRSVRRSVDGGGQVMLLVVAVGLIIPTGHGIIEEEEDNGEGSLPNCLEYPSREDVVVVVFAVVVVAAARRGNKKGLTPVVELAALIVEAQPPRPTTALVLLLLLVALLDKDEEDDEAAKSFSNIIPFWVDSFGVGGMML